MAIRFRKRIRLLPGVTLNLSKSGVSTTVGPRGASVNIGKRGTYLNTGIPGTGLYSRERLDRPQAGTRQAGAEPAHATKTAQAAVSDRPATPAPATGAGTKRRAGWLLVLLGIVIGFVLARMF